MSDLINNAIDHLINENALYPSAKKSHGHTKKDFAIVVLMKTDQKRVIHQ